MTETLEFTQQLSDRPKSAEERSAILANPGFGKHFTDHTAVVDYKVGSDGNGGWSNARIEPYGPIMMDPAAAVLHYGQEIFEGLKAYQHDDGSVWTFIESLRQLVATDKAWVPTVDGEALYLRPFMIATEAFLGVRPAHEVSYRV